VRCPRCDGVLEVHSIGEMQVHECGQCHGVWFEKGELNKLAEESYPDLAWMDFELWKDQELFSVSSSALICPQDEQGMASISYGESGVLVDHCIQCGGTWLDAGELQNIISYMQDEADAMPASEYAKETLEEAAELVTGDKGLAAEWRDFKTILRLLQYRLMVENPKLQEELLDFYRASPFK